MTPDLMACVELAFAAERSGDLGAALEWYRCVPMFTRGRNVQLLAGLTAAADDLPDWVWVRYLAYLVTRCEDGETGRLVKTAAAYVGPAIHQRLMDDCHDRGGDPIQVLARICGESWAFHQFAAHEAGGISAYLDEFAVGRLAERADLSRQWVDAPLSGYEIGESTGGGVLQIREAGQSKWIDVLDLGARACAPQGWVLGRLVPSGIGGGLMFDRHPLGVTKRVATAVAQSGDWLETLATAVERRRIAQADLLREDYELMTDVPELELVRFGTPKRELDRVMMQLRAGRDEVGRAAFRILDRSRREEMPTEDMPYVGAALLNAHAHAEAVRTLRPGHRDRWAAIAEQLPCPARGRGLALAAPARAEAE
ncbi:hypothetical protein [Nocardioides ultimimeridianus]